MNRSAPSAKCSSSNVQSSPKGNSKAKKAKLKQCHDTSASAASGDCIRLVTTGKIVQLGPPAATTPRSLQISGLSEAQDSSAVKCTPVVLRRREHDKKLDDDAIQSSTDNVMSDVSSVSESQTLMPRSDFKVEPPAPTAAVDALQKGLRKRVSFDSVTGGVGNAGTAVSNDQTPSVAETKQKRKKTVEQACTSNVNDGDDGKYDDNQRDNEPELAGEMQKMFETIGVDFRSKATARIKKLEQYTSGYVKSSGRKVEESWKMQQEQRLKLMREFQEHTSAVMNQWQVDVERIKENEEKLQNQQRQQQKLFQQIRLVQSQRLAAMKDLHEEFRKNLDELEKSHQTQQALTQEEWKREMTALQKKLLFDAQKQEMENVRRSLQTIFSG